MAFASTGFLIFLLVGVIVYYLIPKKYNAPQTEVGASFGRQLLFLYVFGCKNARVDYYDDNNNIFGRNMA